METRTAVEALEEIATLLELKGENDFKVRAYRRGARALEDALHPLDELVEAGELAKLKGIGKALSEKLTTLATTGRLPYLEELREEVPDTLLELLRVPGLGTRKLRRLWHELGVETLADLTYACRENRLAKLEGFGARSQEKMLAGAAFLEAARGQRRLAAVLDAAESVCVRLAGLSAVRSAKLVGEVRRRTPVDRRVELMLVTEDPVRLEEELRRAGEPFREAGDGDPGEGEGPEALGDVPWPRLVLRLEDGLEVVLHAVPPARRGRARLLLTGSTGHLDGLRARAAARQVDLEARADELGDDEAGVYRTLELSPIPPEMREGLEELERAAAGPLPPLIEREQLRGVLHLHTTRSDGAETLEAMARRARELGFEYLGVSDHSQSAFYASGLSIEEVARQRREVEEVQARLPDIRILHGIESDILADGALDYPEEVLAAFDFVIGSVHSRFGLSAMEQTRRLVRALENPWLDVLGHPSGRLLLGRPPFPADWETVLDAAAANGVVVEINASPARLDLDYRRLPGARARGLKVSINPDAHSLAGLEDVRWGVHTARKGGLSAEDVLNTRPVEELLGSLRRNRPRA